MKVSAGIRDWVCRNGNGRRRVLLKPSAYISLLFKICAVLLVSTPLLQSHASAAEDDAGRLDLGQALYGQNCASCHGAKLEGQPDWRRRKPDGRMPAPPHDATGHTWHHREDQLFKITKFGTEEIVGDFYKSDMRGFADALSDDEIRAVLAFIASTWPERIRKRVDRANRRQAQ